MPFVPTDIAGLLGWWDASTISGNDGDAIASIADSSGNGNTASQGTAGNRPTLKKAANGIGGQPAMSFDGGDFLDTAAMSAVIKPVTVIAVARFTDFAAFRSIIATTVTLGLRVSGRQTSGVPSGFQHGGTECNGTSGLGTATNRIMAATLNGSNNWAHFRDGAANGSGTTTQTLSGAGLIRLGASVGGANPMLGLIGDVLIYDTVLSAADRQHVEWYLGVKYGIAQSSAFLDIPAATLDVNAITPTIQQDALLDAPPATLDVAAPAPSVAIDSTAVPPAGQMTVAAPVPTLAISNSLAVPVAAVELAAPAPSIQADTSLEAPPAAVEVQAPAPTVATGDNVTVEPPAADLALVAPSPSVVTETAVQVPAGTVSFTGEPPDLAVDTSVGVATATATIGGVPPSLAVSTTATVPTAGVTITALPPGDSVEIPGHGTYGNRAGARAGQVERETAGHIDRQRIGSP